MKSHKLHVFRDEGSNWRWRVIASNGKVTSSSGESFASKSNAIRAAKRANPTFDSVTVDA